ncbi:carboxypeptidase B-like [Centruroides sculpturatus]|uniref:carboxypeptidase B-like n=1 Tax=Centruroides sculpturatus TaxID=218467 RepID=UPI000C6EC097|nr:carboxypeptidase B-like [Centruroides sculpturatus]
MQKKTILLTLCIFASSFAINSDDDDGPPKRYDGYSVFRVTPSNEADLKFLQWLRNDVEFDFWTNPGVIGKPVDIMIPPEKLLLFNESFTANKIDFSLLTNDVQRLIDEENELLNSPEPKRQKRSLLSFFRKFQKKNAFYDYLGQLLYHFQPKIQVVTVGRTFRGNELKLVKLSTGPRNANKPIIWIDGGIHAREWIAPATAMYIIFKILNSYETNKKVRKLLDTYDWYIMPLVNPDGYDYTFKHDRFWRKNRSQSRIHKEGVDLNRNFPFDWNTPNTDVLSRYPNTDQYRGPEPMSELETKAIARTLTEVKERVKLFLTLHSYGQFIMFPWGSREEHCDDYDTLKHVGIRAAEAIRKSSGAQYKSDSINEIVGIATGNSVDWAYGALNIKYSFGFELRDKGVKGWQISTREIIPVGEEVWQAVSSIISDIRL